MVKGKMNRRDTRNGWKRVRKGQRRGKVDGKRKGGEKGGEGKRRGVATSFSSCTHQ